MVRTIEELLMIPQDEREKAFGTFTDEEIHLLAHGYASTAEAVADYLGLDVGFEPICKLWYVSGITHDKCGGGILAWSDSECGANVHLQILKGTGRYAELAVHKYKK